MGNLLETAKNAEDFSTLVAALESVPAPTNAAFDSFFSDFNSTAEEFLADKDLTTLVLSYHVIPSVVPKDDMESALKPLFMSQVGVTTSVPGDQLALTRVTPEGADAPVIRAAGYASAAYLEGDTVWTCNGVINPINYVLMPREATVTKPELKIGGERSRCSARKRAQDASTRARAAAVEPLDSCEMSQSINPPVCLFVCFSYIKKEMI